MWKEKGEGLSNRLVEGTVKYGKENLMMWGCISWHEVGFACRIDGKMDGELYESILENELMKTLKWFGQDVKDIVF